MTHTYAVCKNCEALNKIDISKAKSALCGKCKNPILFHSLVSEVTSQGFQKMIQKSEKPVIVDFWASWCGPCKMYGPEFEKASLENPEAVFIKVNTETEQVLSGSLGIRGIPCTIVFKNGKEVKRQSGAMNSQGVKALLS